MDKNFDELYDKIYKANFEKLEQYRIKEKNKWLLVFIVLSLLPIFIIFSLVVGPMVICIIMLGIVFFGVITQNKKGMNLKKSKTSKKCKTEKTYQDVFKENIVKPIIENIFEGAQYKPKQGINALEYRKAGYKEFYNRYSSDDLVIAPVQVNSKEKVSITFSEVHTEEEKRDNDGDLTQTTVFQGLVCYFSIPKDLNAKIYIRKNGRISKSNKNRVKMDMLEFEKIFDVESNNNILTMQILTSDMMTEMVDIYQRYKYQFEISIIGNMVYIRLKTGKIFEPEIFKKSIEYKQMKKYYQILQEIKSIAIHIYKTINIIDL